MSVASDQALEYDIEVSVVTSEYLFSFPKRFLQNKTMRIDSKSKFQIWRKAKKEDRDREGEDSPYIFCLLVGIKILHISKKCTKLLVR